MKVTIEITVDVRDSDDLKVFYAQAMQGDEQAAAKHPRTMQLISKLARAIDHESVAVRPDRSKAGG